MNPVYAVYVSTHAQGQSCAQRMDEAQLRGICAEVATLDGFEGRISPLAPSDAEHGLKLRPPSAVLWLLQHDLGTRRNAGPRVPAAG